jgi:hypothetical protein
MNVWIGRLDDFMKLSGRDILTHAGKISAEIAKLKADTEYDRFKERTKYELSPVEQHFLDSLEKTAKTITKKGGKK